MSSASKAAILLSKFQGTLVGAAVGDCLGSPYEGFFPIPIEDLIEKTAKFETTDKSPSTAVEFTDDTAMLRSVANSLIAIKSFDATDMAKRFSEEFFKEPDRGYGGAIATVFESLKKSEYQDVYRPASKQFQGSGSFGNGGAMRIAPAALFSYSYNDHNKLQELVENITRLTHTHRKAIQGSIIQSMAVDLALRESDTTSLDPNKFLDTLIDYVEPDEKAFVEKEEIESPEKKNSNKKKDPCQLTPYTYKLNLIKEMLKADHVDSEIIEDELGTSVSAVGSVPTAIYSFLRSLRDIEGMDGRNGFERSILLAISYGGDTDTIATMAAAISGAYYGLEAIPVTWIERCEGTTDALQQATSLHDLHSEQINS